MWRLAWRNLWRNRTRSVLLLTALVVGYLGMAAIMSVSAGLLEAMLENQVDHGVGHVQIHARGFLKDHDIKRSIPDPAGIVRTLRALEPHALILTRIRVRGILASAEGSYPVEILASLPDREEQHRRLARYLTHGGWPESDRDILIGWKLARRLRVRVGDRVVFTTADIHGELVSDGYRVRGIFDSPSRALNESVAFIRLSAGQHLLGYGRGVNEIVIQLPDRSRLTSFYTRLVRRLPPDLEAATWQQLQPALQYQVESFTEMNLITVVTVFIAAAFGIMNVFYMALYERLREFGILRAIGVPPTMPGRLLIREALLLYGCAAVVGNALALGLYTVFHDRGIDLSRFSDVLAQVGSDAVIYPRPDYINLALTLIILFVCMLLALIPVMRKIRRISPAEAMRHV